MRKIQFVAKRRLDHERWLGEDGSIVRLDTLSKPFLVGVATYTILTDGRTPCVVLDARKLPWSDDVRRVLFPDSPRGKDFESLVKDAQYTHDVRSVAWAWYRFSWTPTPSDDVLELALNDAISAEDAYQITKSVTHPAVRVAVWNRVIKAAMKRHRSVWVSGAMCAHERALNPDALRMLHERKKIVKEHGRIAFVWAYAQIRHLHGERTMYDDQDADPTDDLSVDSGDLAASVDAFVDSHRVCNTMLKDDIKWVARNPFVLKPTETFDVPRRKLMAWLDTHATPRDLVVAEAYGGVVRVFDNRAVDVRPSMVNKSTLVIDGTREVTAEWAKSNIATYSLRNGFDDLRILPPGLRFDKVYAVTDGATRECALRECCRFGQLVLIKLK